MPAHQPRPSVPDTYQSGQLAQSATLLTYTRTYIHTHIKHTDNILGIFVGALVRDFGFFVLSSWRSAWRRSILSGLL